MSRRGSSLMPKVNFTSSGSPSQHEARQLLWLRGHSLGGVCVLWAREESRRGSGASKGMGWSPGGFLTKWMEGRGWGAGIGHRAWWKGDIEGLVGRDMSWPVDGEGRGLHWLRVVRGVR